MADLSPTDVEEAMVVTQVTPRLVSRFHELVV
jgi:hypothetical protein